MKTKPNDIAYPVVYDENLSVHSGLTKREYFAAMAMQGMCSNMDNANLQNSTIIVTSEAVRFADALIEQLNKEGE